MMNIIEVPLPKGSALFLTTTIAGAHTNLANGKHTDVYTDSFPEGITIAMHLDAFAELWEEALEEEAEISFEPDSVLIKLLKGEQQDGG
mgnify:CR=1 FL=1|jgi:hypothetical protein